MQKVLYIQASPRGARSRSIALTDAFLQAYRQANPDETIDTLDLFEAELIPFDGHAVAAKYATLRTKQHTDAETAAWKPVEATIDRFTSAHKYVLAVPMWNFGIPYRLKQYIDILVQPGYTFSYSSDEGYKGLLTGKRAFLGCARGGDYSESQAKDVDFQERYLRFILTFIGITDVRSVIVEPTLASGPEVAETRLRSAVEEARRLAKDF